MWRALFVICTCLAFGADIGSFVVMNARTGRVLSERNAHHKMYPASTTKIATLAYVLSTPDLDLQQRIVVPSEAVRILSDVEKSRDHFTHYPSYVLEARSSLAGFKAGEIITLKDAIYGSMLASGNDASNTLAYYWGNRSIEQCVERINGFVASLGCLNTSFQNPHGLHHPEHISTAYDLALLTRYAMQNPLFRKVVSTPTFTKSRTNKQKEVTWNQTNRLLVSGPYYYKHAIGVKTGHHARAGYCLVAAAENQDRSLIAVLLNVPERKDVFITAKSMLHKFLSEQKVERAIVQEGPVQLKKVLEGHSSPLSLAAMRGLNIEYYPSEEPGIRACVEWNALCFPIRRGQQIGCVHVLVDDEEIAKVPLISQEERSATWYQRFLEVQNVLRNHRGKVFLILFATLIFFFWYRRRV